MGLLPKFLLKSNREVDRSLLFVHLRSDISWFKKLFAQPVRNRKDIFIVETLDLMRVENERASHFWKTFWDFFRKLDFVSQRGVIFKLDIHAHQKTSNSPAKTSQNLIKRWHVLDSSSIVSRFEKHVTYSLVVFCIFGIPNLLLERH